MNVAVTVVSLFTVMEQVGAVPRGVCSIGAAGAGGIRHARHFRTDANGGGVLRLAVGGYDFDVTVSGPAGGVLSVPDAEGGIGFGVYA